MVAAVFTRRQSGRRSSRSSAETIEGGRERLELAENELRRLAREIADVPDDPKAPRRAAIPPAGCAQPRYRPGAATVRGKAVRPRRQRALAARLKPLETRRACDRRAGKDDHAAPEGKEGRARFPHEAARDAGAKTGRAAETLLSQNTQEIADRKNEARQALERLANELARPAGARQEPTRQRFARRGRQSNELAEEISRSLRETDPRPDRPATTDGAAAELAARLNGTADKQSQVVGRARGDGARGTFADRSSSGP